MATSTTTTAAFVAPRVGGGTTADDVWVGGSLLAGKRLTKLKSLYAWHPSTFKEASIVEKFCTEGLPEQQQLGLSEDTDSKVDLMTWLPLM